MVSEPPIMVVPCCEVAMTDAEKESEARCKEMLNQLISVVKKQTLEIEDLAESMKELAAGLKAVVQPLGATAHALPPPVPAPTATLVTMVDHAVAAAAPRAEAALIPESPTKCSTSGPDTNAGDIQVVAESEPEKGVPTVAPALAEHSSAPSPKLFSTIKQDTVTPTRCSTACRSCNTDVAITSHAPSIGADVDHAEAEATPCTDSIRAAMMLANCSTPRGGLKAWFRELPGGMLDSLPMEEVMQCPSENDCAQLCTKLDDEMPRKWFDCYQGGVPWMPPWPPPQGPGTLLELFHKQAGVQSWMTKFTNAAMDMLNSHELPWDPGDANLSNIDSRCFVIVKSRAKGRKTPLLILLRTPNIQFIMMAAELVKQCSDINNMDSMLVRCKNDKGSEKDLMDNFIEDKLMIDVLKMLRLFPGFGKWVCNNPRDRVGAVLTDGETVLKEVELEDPLEILGVKLVRQAGARTNDIAGDDCTTSTILAQGLIAEGMKVLAAGINPVQIARGIEKTAAALVSELKLKSREIEVREIAHVAAVSAGNDYSVGDMISDAFKRVGRKGTVRIENGRGTETGLEIVKGMQFERGYLSPYFVTDRANMSVEFIDCKILLVDKKSTDASEIIKILDSTVKENYPLLITAEDMEEEARAPLIRNKLSGTIKVAAIKAPSFGEQKTQCLDDIAIMTGGTVVRDDMGYTLERAGKEVYSYFMEDKNVTLFFSCVYPLVGATLDDHYTAFGDLDKSRQALVEQWSKVAYEHMKFDQFDYEMDNGQARLTDRGTFQGSTLRSNFTGLLQGHTGQEIFAESNFQAGQQGASVSNGVSVGSEFSGSNSQHCTLKRVGSVRVRQFTSVHENNANAAEAWW